MKGASLRGSCPSSPFVNRAAAWKRESLLRGLAMTERLPEWCEVCEKYHKRECPEWEAFRGWFCLDCGRRVRGNHMHMPEFTYLERGGKRYPQMVANPVFIEGMAP